MIEFGLWVVFCFVAPYMLISFVTWEFSLARWNELERLGLMLMGLAILLLSLTVKR
jgi:hypothetical protein